MNSWRFWIDAIERLVKTGVQVAATIGILGLGKVLTPDAGAMVWFVIVACSLSFVTSIASLAVPGLSPASMGPDTND